MLSQRSKSAAPGAERPILAPVWLLLLLGGLIVIALVLIYPQQNLIQRVVKAPESELSSAYVTNLLRTDPDNPRLRLLLASQALDHGHFADLRQTLQPALDADDPAVRREALWLLWQAGAQELNKLPRQNTAQPQAVRQQLARQLVELAKEDWPTQQKTAIADRAFAFGEPAVGIALYHQLAKQSQTAEEAAERYAEGGKAALTHAQYRASAELYLLARQKTSDPAQARTYYLTALRTLQSGNLSAEALRIAEREIGPLADDHETLFFVTRLARAAGRPEVADRYVRKLLRLSLLRQLEQVRLAEPHGGALPQKVSLRAGGPQLPFDDKTYTLGYEVFLENRKLEDAWKVAASAVRQSPADMAWRERLAKVAEWTSRPAMALDHWWHLARETQRDEAWQAVLRLAPGLLNDPALISALQYQLTRQPHDLRQLKELIAAWERQGQPKAALDYLERHNQRSARPQTLEMMAELADRAAEPQLALRTWQRLLEQSAEATPPRLVKAATLALLQGNNAQALHWLELATGNNDDESEREILRLTGKLAAQEQREAQAIGAFTRLSLHELAEETDFDALIGLLNSSHPREAARVASRAWERFGHARHLIQCLDLYAGEQQWTAIGPQLGRLSPTANPPYNKLAELRRRPEFLRISGAYHQQAGQLAEARRDIAAALALAPASTDLQSAMLWLLIDSNDAPGLRRFLASREPAWRHDASMHDSLAAAYLALSRPKVALDRYLTPRLGAHQNDFLWLMNYADALDQNQQSDRAWRLRRHLLSGEWRANQTATVNPKNRQKLKEKGSLAGDDLDPARRLARTRLLLTQRSGDGGLDALRELLRLDRDADGKYSNAAMETAIGWLQDAGEYSAVRGHLWQQYARSQGKAANRPLWAEISVALASDDPAALRPILEQYGERLPRYDRISAAQRLGDTGQAQSDAFETQDDQSDDDPLHMQLAESLLTFSDHAGFSLANRQLGAIDEQLAGADWHLALTPKLALDFQLGSLQRSNRDDAVIRNVPDERFVSLRVNWQHDDGQTTLLAEQRHSLTNFTPLQLEHEHRIDNRLSLRIGLGQHLPSLESLPLRVAGMKDRAAFTLSYQPTRVDRISFEQLFERYEIQTGSAVGRGTHSTLTVAHALRDLDISAFWSTHHFSREASYNDPALAPLLPTGMASVSALQPSFFLPDNFDFYGIRLSTDMRYERQYTRALRPYGSLAGTWHSALGAGYDLRFGVAGSLLGADHFSLTWGQSKAGVQTGGRTRDLNFNYRLHY